MPIDASIYSNYLRSPKSIQDFDNEAMQAQGNALALQQQRMQMNALMQQQAEDRALRNYLSSGADLSTPEGQAGLYKAAPKSAGGILKTQAEIAKEKAQTGLYGAQTDEAKQKTEKGAFDLRLQKANEAIKDISALKTPEEARASITRHQQKGDIDFQQASAMLNAVPDDLGQFAKWRNDTVMRILDAKTRLEMTAPKYEKIDNGGQITLLNTNALSDTPGSMLGSPIKKVATPGDLLQAETTRRGQNMTDSRERQLAAQGVTYQTDSDGNLVALPSKAVPGAPIRGASVVGNDGKPIAGKGNQLPEAAQKQVMGARNLQDAVGGYLSKLESWSNSKMLSPDQRAEMGNAYNNMMLQAKEAYNLGVLTGPDYDILQSVVKDPTKLTSVLTSNQALGDQARSLRNIAANIEKTALEAHGKKYTPRQDAGKQLSPEDQQAAAWAQANSSDPRAAKIKQRLGL